MLMVGQIIAQLIIISFSVYESKFKTKMEYFNEIILMLTMYTIMCYTPFIFDVPTKHKIGYVTIAVVVLHLFVNFFFIFRESYKSMFLKCRYYKLRKANKKYRA